MFLRWKLDKFTLFTHSLVGWNLENLYKHAVPILSEKNTFLKKKRTDYTYIKLRVQDFATGKNFSFNQ